MFQRTEQTNRLCEMFRTSNGLVTYERIEQEFSAPIADLRPNIANALKYLERDEGIVYETVRKTGYRRLTDAEKVQSAAGFTRKIHRTAGRGVTRLDAVSDFTALSNEDQMTATIRRTVFNAVQRETNLDRD